MKKCVDNLLRITMAVLMLINLCSLTAFAEEETRFTAGTSVNGISISGLTVEEANVKMAGYYAGEYRLTLIRKGGTPEYISGTEIGYQAVIPEGLQAILDEQNATGRNSGPAVNSSYDLPVKATFNEEALHGKIETLACISGTEIRVTSNAGISGYQEGHEFEIIPEVYGNSIDKEKLKAAVSSALSTGRKEIKLYEEGCYDAVTVTSADEALITLCNIMNQCRRMTVTYVFGEEIQESLSGEEIVAWLTGTDGDGQIGVNRELAAAYVKTLADKYDTVGTPRIFRTTAGSDLELTGPYGWKIDQAAETDALIGMIRTGQSQSREPQYVRTGVGRSGPDWGNSYVEIDLTGQHVYMYQDGVLAWDAPCVTGNVSKDYTTPPGIFGLTYKERDKVLRGKKMEDGTYEYESPVKYWMPFNGGIGLHDADWRSDFGGSIYRTGGSHGCINLPPSKTEALYELVYQGIPVICYN